MAMAGLAGCTKQPDEPIYPYVKAPEDLILGKPNYFATAFPFSTGALPLLVKSDAYRPIKVDGNPEHPMSMGGSDPLSQASLLGLYDPDRSQHVLYRGETSLVRGLPGGAGPRSGKHAGRTGPLHPELDHHLAYAGRAMEGRAEAASRRRS